MTVLKGVLDGALFTHGLIQCGLEKPNVVRNDRVLVMYESLWFLSSELLKPQATLLGFKRIRPYCMSYGKLMCVVIFSSFLLT